MLDRWTRTPGAPENPGLPDDQADPDVDLAPASSIVVGHDGSGAATAALRWALQLASELGAPVTILRAWLIVTAPRPDNWAFGAAALFMGRSGDFRDWKLIRGWARILPTN